MNVNAVVGTRFTVPVGAYPQFGEFRFSIEEVTDTTITLYWDYVRIYNYSSYSYSNYRVTDLKIDGTTIMTDGDGTRNIASNSNAYYYPTPRYITINNSKSDNTREFYCEYKYITDTTKSNTVQVIFKYPGTSCLNYNGTNVTDVYFNGTKANHVYINGTQIY